MNQPSRPGSAHEALEQSLHTTWNARVVDYDGERFPFAALLLEEVRKLGFAVDDLTRIHEQVPEREVYGLTKALCAATHRPDLRDLVHEFVAVEVVPRGRLVLPVAVQRFLNVRVMLPDRPHGVFPFHTGLAYGHGRASRSLWLPLTDVSAEGDSSASLQIIELGRSRELTRQAERTRLGIGEMTALFGGECHAIRAAPGQMVLFSQENIHGNFVNRTGKTRVSIDFRVAEARFADELARKKLGGYFELVSGPKPASRSLDAMRNGRSNVIYLNNSTTEVEGAPAHLQRALVVNRCAEHGIPFEFELFELERMDHLPTLRHVVHELGCNVILYSIYSLPEVTAVREEILEATLARGLALYFANEGIVVSNAEQRAHLEELLGFARHGDLDRRAGA